MKIFYAQIFQHFHFNLNNYLLQKGWNKAFQKFIHIKLYK